MKFNYEIVRGYHPVVEKMWETNENAHYHILTASYKIKADEKYVGDVFQVASNGGVFIKGWVAVRNDEVLEVGFKTRKAACLYLVENPEEVVQTEEAPAVKEFTIYRKNDVHIVSAPQGEYALTIGGMFNIDYKDEHGEYFIENLLFMGSGPANDCLLFKNEREDILHMDPLKVQRVTIPFPKEHETVFGVFKEEEPERKVIEYRSMSWGLEYYSMFREIAVVDGNQFGYFLRKTESGDMEYKVMCFNDEIEAQQVLAYESDCEGLEKCINLFLLNGFQFGTWEMRPQKVRVKVIDNKKEREEKLVAAQSKVDRFERYRDLLDKSLSRKGLTDEEREEMFLLYDELELSDGRNYYILAQASHMAMQGGEK